MTGHISMPEAAGLTGSEAALLTLASWVGTRDPVPDGAEHETAPRKSELTKSGKV
jgi:hypothetical protein